MKRFHLGTMVLVAASILASGAGRAQSLADLWRLQKGRSHRVSSVNPDPNSNRDYLTLQPGDTAELADIEGPGVIRHIWFTIAAEDYYYPRHLILRAWWDDEPTPSMEARSGTSLRWATACEPTWIPWRCRPPPRAGR